MFVVLQASRSGSVKCQIANMWIENGYETSTERVWETNQAMLPLTTGLPPFEAVFL